MHSLAEPVLARVRRQELLRAGDRVGVAVSGGIDSVALLRLLLELRHELGIVLSVVHFNHKLRGAESDSDQDFVASLALERGLEFYCQSGDVAGLAVEEHSGVEAAARELRYGFFQRLLGAGGDAVPSELLTGSRTSGAEAQNLGPPYRSAESAAPPQGTLPPQSTTQGLKPASSGELNGTSEAVPCPIPIAKPAPQATSTGLTPAALLNKIATGHTLDDQAETVLMRLIRGTGLRGLGGIYPRIVVENEDGEGHGEIVRPLLGIRRRELEQYLADLKQPWREDSTNAESKFTRNRVRGLVLPLLEREFNPAVVESFAELAEIARDEEDYWENEISGWLGTVVQWSQPEWTRGLPGFEGSQSLVQIQPSNPELLNRLEQPGPAVMNASVSRPWLLTEPIAVQRRVLKAIGEQAGIPLEFKHIEEILHFAAEDGPSGKELSLPLGWKIVREPEALVFITPDLRRQERVPDYEYSLPVPGRAMVPELGVVIEAMRLAPESLLAEYNPQHLLRAELLPRHLIVRNWRPGDRFWPAHTKAPKKIKELLQERHVEQPRRRLWPVAANEDEIVWMRDFSVPAGLRPKAGEEAVLIREIPWEAQERATET
ncbi:MAG: tRNA lysidine(34) synthetase TilS [Candidatus Sulfotelmatobacter sp.]